MNRKILSFIIVVGILFLAGCNSAPTPTPFQLFQGPTAALPTRAPVGPATPTSTSVMEHLATASPQPSATPLPDEAFGLITAVLDTENVAIILDGDTFNNIYTVRLLGIDAPNNSITDPWGIVAFEMLDRWLSGKVVRIVQDTTVRYDDGALPRYLYLDNELINLRMVELGLAEPSFQSPDTELEAEFNRAAQDAEADGLGLWGANPTATPLSTATPEISDTTVETVTVTLPALTATTTITATGTPIITTTATITATTP